MLLRLRVPVAYHERMFSPGFIPFLDLLMNLTLLVALTILSDFVENRAPRTTRAGVMLQGLLFGMTAALGMLRPLNMGAGLIFDGRSVMVSLCSLYFGPWAAAISGAITIGVRLSLGGAGTLMGVLVTLESALIGLGARGFFRPDDNPLSTYQLYVFGLVVHVVMDALMLTLPGSMGVATFKRIGLLVIGLYPLATILAGKLLSDQVRSRLSVVALRESEERFMLSMEATNDGMWDVDVATGRSYYNPAYYRILGYEPGDFPTLSSSWSALVHPEDLERALRSNSDCIDGRVDTVGIEYRMKAKDGTWRWIYARGKCVQRDRSGRAVRLVGTHVDITERKLAEERLERNLAEKEVLLREVHHRVKNNLNVISGLLNLQASTIQSPEQAIAAFQNSRERVMAMAMVHEELYKSRDYAHVDMEDYLQKLTRHLSLVYGARGDIRLVAQARGVSLSVSASIPCGLILNELITNAYKYAFPDGRQGSIRVSMSDAPDGMVGLVVADDGIGLPAGYAEEDRQDSGSLGLTLVRLLVEQLGGSMTASSRDGTTFSMAFPGNPPQ